MKKYNLAFIDLLLCFLSASALLLVLALANFAEVTQKNKGNVISPAQYIIEMEWDDNSNSDVDLWVSSPTGGIVMYSIQDIALLTLDRDNLGHSNNSVMQPDGTILVDKTRKEVVAVRGLTAGNYTVNALLFKQAQSEQPEVTVTVRRLNPYQEVYKGTYRLTLPKQEHTFVTFTLDANGDVVMQDGTQVSLYTRLQL